MAEVLPIGIQSFRVIRQDGLCHVDKTAHVRNLVESGRRYFLSRPRRFGKSLLVSTIHSLFACERELFDGLAIEPHWNWSAPHPVVCLSFGSGHFNEPNGLRRRLAAQLEDIEEDAGIKRRHDGTAERFAYLLRRLHRAARRGVVILVDEYDKPILDVLHRPDIACANRDYLRDLYAVI